MITRPTVLVLGAGASAPYGFPTGAALKDKVLEVLDRPPFSLLPPGRSKDELSEFARVLRESGAESVDWPLERRPEFLEYGKDAMALKILECEKDGAFASSVKNEDHWCQYLWTTMETRRGLLSANKLSTVTFNYDRSFERFLVYRLMNLYKLSEKDAVAESSQIEVVHVHGSVGDREFVDVPYNLLQIRQDDVRMARERIKVVSDGNAANPTAEYRRARELIDRAEAVGFLGFGFHKNNVERLALPGLAMRQPERRWFATHKGLHPMEFQRLTSKFTAAMTYQGNQGNVVAGTCTHLLKGTRILHDH
jgi:hypothetical protein